MAADPADVTVIGTPRLALRFPQPDDAAPLAALMTADVSRWVASWPHPFSTAMALDRITAAEAAIREGRSFHRLMTGREDGAVMGWLGIALTGDEPRTGSLGYWLGTAFHGHGYIGEALPPFIHAAKTRLRLERLEAGVQPANAASLAALKRIGMTFVAERMHWVPARRREERTAFYALSFPD